MEGEITSLDAVPVGYCVKVIDIKSDAKQRNRMLDLGIVKNSKIKVLQYSPFGDPIAYFVKGTALALRKEDAQKILVEIIN